MTRFLVVPQWQGSPAARAMHLVDGAEAIAGDLPRASTARVEVPASAGEALGTGIRRYSALARIAGGGGHLDACGGGAGKIAGDRLGTVDEVHRPGGGRPLPLRDHEESGHASILSRRVSPRNHSRRERMLA